MLLPNDKKKVKNIENDLPMRWQKKKKKLLQSIYNQQVASEDPFFPIGVFRSFRENKALAYRRPDDNIFATASTIFILHELRRFLGEEEQILVDKMTQKAHMAYDLYKNKDGLATYNFWKTRPTKHFPNGTIFGRMKHFKLPDDIDDTALVYLTTSPSDNEWLKSKLLLHTDRTKPTPYSTWFGEKMPLEHDVCALCNLMYWVFENRLQLNTYDEATLAFLNEAIVSKEFLKNPFKVARHYATVPLICYHYARLLSKFDVPQLKESLPILQETIREELLKEDIGMNRILLENAWMKLKKNTEIIAVDLPNFEENRSQFYSFIGALLASYNAPIAGWKIARINWKCAAHETALVLENLVLRAGLMP